MGTTNSISKTTSTHTSALKGATAMVMVAMLGLALKGIFAKLAYGEGMNVGQVLAGRLLLATPVFWGVAWWLGRLKGWRPKAAEWRSLGLGAVFLVAAGADFAAIDYLGAGPSRVLLFSYPGWVLVIEALRRRRMPAPHHVGVFGVAWVGLVLVSLPEGLSSIGIQQLTGIGFAMLAAISYAWFTASSQRLVEEMGSVRFVVASNTGATLALLAAAPWLDLGAGDVTVSGMGWLVAMAWVATVGPVFLTFEAIGRMGAERVGLFMLLGPVVTLAAAWFVLGEVLTGTQVVGTTLVVGAIAALRALDARLSAPRPARRAPRA